MAQRSRLVEKTVALFFLLTALFALGHWHRSGTPSLERRASTDEDDSQCAVNIPGYHHNGDCNLLCRPPTWIDMLTFYLGNYVAHAATIFTSPGQSAMAGVYHLIVALLFPGSGVSRGVAAIASRAKLAPTDLQIAARAGALCAVVKAALPAREMETETELHSPEPHGEANPETAAHVTVPDPDTLVEKKSGPAPVMAVNVQGFWRLPQGYEMVVVLHDATFVEDDALLEDSASRTPWHRRVWAAAAVPFSRPKNNRRQPIHVASSYNMAKAVVALFQLGYAVTTLYQSAGNQVQRYGYAAFGLTVAPYAWMSFVNLLANLACPQYDAMYVVESEGLDDLRQAIKAGESARASAADAHPETPAERPYFGVECTIGRLSKRSDEMLQRHLNNHHDGQGDWDELRAISGIYHDKGSTGRVTLQHAANLVVSGVPVAIIGGLSGFHKGRSALYQRVWTMLWLAIGSAQGVGLAGGLSNSSEPVDPKLGFGIIIFGAALYGAAAIGGYVVVGEMMEAFGVCSELS